MRDSFLWFWMAMLAIVTALLVVMVMASQPQQDQRLHNGYWPFAVETSVKDK